MVIVLFTNEMLLLLLLSLISLTSCTPITCEDPNLVTTFSSTNNQTSELFCAYVQEPYAMVIGRDQIIHFYELTTNATNYYGKSWIETEEFDSPFTMLANVTCQVRSHVGIVGAFNNESGVYEIHTYLRSEGVWLHLFFATIDDADISYTSIQLSEEGEFLILNMDQHLRLYAFAEQISDPVTSDWQLYRSVLNVGNPVFTMNSMDVNYYYGWGNSSNFYIYNTTGLSYTFNFGSGCTDVQTTNNGIFFRLNSDQQYTGYAHQTFDVVFNTSTALEMTFSDRFLFLNNGTYFFWTDADTYDLTTAYNNFDVNEVLTWAVGDLCFVSLVIEIDIVDTNQFYCNFDRDECGECGLCDATNVTITSVAIGVTGVTYTIRNGGNCQRAMIQIPVPTCVETYDTSSGGATCDLSLAAIDIAERCSSNSSTFVNFCYEDLTLLNSCFLNVTFPQPMVIGAGEAYTFSQSYDDTCSQTVLSQTSLDCELLVDLPDNVTFYVNTEGVRLDSYDTYYASAVNYTIVLVGRYLQPNANNTAILYLPLPGCTTIESFTAFDCNATIALDGVFTRVCNDATGSTYRIDAALVYDETSYDEYAFFLCKFLVTYSNNLTFTILDLDVQFQSTDYCAANSTVGTSCYTAPLTTAITTDSLTTNSLTTALTTGRATTGRSTTGRSTTGRSTTGSTTGEVSVLSTTDVLTTNALTTSVTTEDITTTTSDATTGEESSSSTDTIVSSGYGWIAICIFTIITIGAVFFVFISFKQILKSPDKRENPTLLLGKSIQRGKYTFRNQLLKKQ